jgi:hypothetical protein
VSRSWIRSSPGQRFRQTEIKPEKLGGANQVCILVSAARWQKGRKRADLLFIAQVRMLDLVAEEGCQLRERPVPTACRPQSGKDPESGRFHSLSMVPIGPSNSCATGLLSVSAMM